MVDRQVERGWSLDLAQAGKEPSSAPERRKAARQGVVAFVGREGSEERFSILMTFPDDEGLNEEPASQKQHDAVAAFYGVGPANRDQAGYLMSAWSFADEIRSARNFGFSAPRRALIHVATAAYLLGDRELRTSVRSWADHRWRSPSRAARVDATAPWRPALRFANDLIADMQAAGSKIFG